MNFDPLAATPNPALRTLGASVTAPSVPDLGSAGTAGAGKKDDFASKLMDVLKEVNSSQQQAASKENAFMTGQQVDYHDLMISVQKASVEMQLTMAVRNKVLEAYTDISHMQV